MDEQNRARFQDLRRRETDGLTPDEQNELDALITEMDAEEAELLRPALERMDKQARQLAAQNRALADVLQQRLALAQRLEQVLEEARSEDRRIQERLSSVLSGTE